jgi:Asp-tRNA(Asn)/Glu-tRNA(Gln) amidotransferase A subunit family amidase
VVGKTVTTEFAFTDPTPCRNPHDLDRSPGGSSSGSGAAVGAGMVDIALGTQTAGSLCRPAAYCGAVGFKPTYGALPMGGVTPLSPSHVTVGIVARTVDLAERAFVAMRGEVRSEGAPIRRAGAALLDASIPVATDMRAAFEEARAALAERLGGEAAQVAVPDAAAIVEDHGIVMIAEAARHHGGLLSAATRDLLRSNFRAALEAGASCAPETVAGARRRLAAARDAFWAGHTDVELVLTLPVPDTAPRLGGSTGFQHWLTVWTVLGGPLLCLPWGLDGRGLPRSVMLAGRPGEDARLLAFGKAFARAAPETSPPVPPAG